MKLILFDAGNTLVWVDHPYLLGLLGEYGYEVTEEQLLEAEYAAKRMMDELIRSGNSGTDASRGPIYFARVLAEVGVDPSLLPSLAPRIAARHAESNLWCRVRPGTAEALRELRERGHRLGVISNSDGRIEELLASVGLAEYFDFIIDSHVVGFEKPDPRIFHLGCERGGVAPEDVVYVGDLYEIDVVGARGAGLRAVLIDPLGRWTDLDCDRIAGVHELPARLGPLAA
jgi:HAD superfamily hydrolase (TIGR01509 family)